jgi:hypothetical protein
MFGNSSSKPNTFSGKEHAIFPIDAPVSMELVLGWNGTLAPGYGEGILLDNCQLQE